MNSGSWTISEYHVYNIVEQLGLLEGRGDKNAVMELQKRLMAKHMMKRPIIRWAEEGVEATSQAEVVVGVLRFFPEQLGAPVRTYSICSVTQGEVVSLMKQIAVENWDMCQLMDGENL